MNAEPARQSKPRAATPRPERKDEPKKDRALKVLRKMILKGTFQGGKSITEQAVVEATKLTKTPVRQALARLEAEEVVEVDSRRMTRVRPGTPMEIQSILGLRYVLEGFVASSLARAWSKDEGLGELDSIQEKMKILADASSGEPDVEDRYRFVELDIAFHVTLAKLAGYEPAMQFLANLHTKIQVFATLALQTRAIMHDVLGEHESIIEAIRSRDEKAARIKAHEHLEKAADRWFPYAKKFLRDVIPSLMGMDTEPAPEEAHIKEKPKQAKPKTRKKSLGVGGR